MYEYAFILLNGREAYQAWLESLKDAPASLEIVSVNNVYWSFGITYRYLVESE